MLYDKLARDAVADALRDGFTGRALTVRVGKAIDAEVKVDTLSPAEYDLLNDAFKKIVHPAAVKSANAAKAKAKTKTEKSKPLF